MTCTSSGWRVVSRGCLPACDLVSQYRRAGETASGSGRLVVVALEDFHGGIDALQPLGAATAVGVMEADELAVAQADAGQVEVRLVFQLEEPQGVALLVAAAVQTLPEAVQQLLHIRAGGGVQLVHVQVVVAQRIDRKSTRL